MSETGPFSQETWAFEDERINRVHQATMQIFDDHGFERALVETLSLLVGRVHTLTVLIEEQNRILNGFDGGAERIAEAVDGFSAVYQDGLASR